MTSIIFSVFIKKNLVSQQKNFSFDRVEEVQNIRLDLKIFMENG